MTPNNWSFGVGSSGVHADGQVWDFACISSGGMFKHQSATLRHRNDANTAWVFDLVELFDAPFSVDKTGNKVTVTADVQTGLNLDVTGFLKIEFTAAGNSFSNITATVTTPSSVLDLGGNGLHGQGFIT